MAELKPILLVDDNPNDVELALAALAENRLANDVIIARDGAEALDYLYRRGGYSRRAKGNPVVVLLDLKLPKVDGLEVPGGFRGIHRGDQGAGPVLGGDQSAAAG
jgi:CheY-like chemotaxis protein